MHRFRVICGLALLMAFGRASHAVLADPSTVVNYTCLQLQNTSLVDAVYGSIPGRIYRPAIAFGACTAASPTPAGRPVVLFFNGAGYTQNDYDYLGYHLAANGFIVAVVRADEPNPVLACAGPSLICIEDRARKGLAFLKLMKEPWTWAPFADFTNLSVAGHSRGGEAAVEAAAIVRWEEDELGNPGVRAVISLAPTDEGDDGLIGRRRLLGRESPAFLLLYGSRDEQVQGPTVPSPPFAPIPHRSAFALYDRAGSEGSLEGFPISLDNQVERTMQFIYRANHHQFSDLCGNLGCSHTPLDCDWQHRITKGFVNAYLRWKIWGESVYRDFFDGTFEGPWGFEIWPQFSEGEWGSRRVIDNFQDGTVNNSTIGGLLTVFGGLDAEVVDNWTTDPRSMHGAEDGWRLRVERWGTSTVNSLYWWIPSGKGNVSQFTHLSFRIGQGTGAEDAARVTVQLRRGGLWSPALSSDVYGMIPAPDELDSFLCLGSSMVPDRTITHMRTIRIPLAAFGGDLTSVDQVQIRFSHESTLDKVFYLDNVEFTGGDDDELGH